jgi:hypothetical protein
MDKSLPKAGELVSSIVINTYDGSTHTIDFKEGTTVIAGVVSSDEFIETGVVKFSRILINSKSESGASVQSNINYER